MRSSPAAPPLFEQRRLRARRHAVDLVDQQQVGEDRPFVDPEFARRHVEHARAGDVGRHQIRRALDAAVAGTLENLRPEERLRTAKASCRDRMRLRCSTWPPHTRWSALRAGSERHLHCRRRRAGQNSARARAPALRERYTHPISSLCVRPPPRTPAAGAPAAARACAGHRVRSGARGSRASAAPPSCGGIRAWRRAPAAARASGSSAVDKPRPVASVSRRRSRSSAVATASRAVPARS